MNAEFWNERYGTNPSVYGGEPNAFLKACEGMLPASGRALLPGDGQGRNGLWLATKGLRPLCNDLSAIALEQVAAKAAARSLPVEIAPGDILEIPLANNAFAFSACVHFHLPSGVRERAHARIVAALAPGGIVILEAYAKGHKSMRQTHGSVGGPPDEDMMFSTEILRSDFAALEPLYIEEMELVVEEGAFHRGLGRVVRAIFQKA